MNEQLRLLVELQKLDTRIIAHQRVIIEIPLKISAMDKPLREARENLEAQRAKVDGAEKNKREAERNVEEMAEKIEKLKSRTSDIRTNKEYQALLSEIKTAETTKFETEDGILEYMVAQDDEQAALAGTEADLKTQEQEAQKLKAALEAEVKGAQQELTSLKDSRVAFTDALDEEVYDNYIKLLTDSHGLAVTSAEDEICSGCNMNIMPQLFLHLKQNKEIIHCPQCNRILYYIGENPEASATASPDK